MLATAHYMLGHDELCVVPPTHRNHPATKWVMHNKDNYVWLYRHLKSLLEEYLHRHGVPHHYSEYLDHLENIPTGIDYRHHNPTCPPAIVSADLKPKHTSWESVVEAYRAYYNRDKRHLHRWMVREKPDWIIDDATLKAALEQAELEKQEATLGSLNP